MLIEHMLILSYQFSVNTILYTLKHNIKRKTKMS